MVRSALVTLIIALTDPRLVQWEKVYSTSDPHASLAAIVAWGDSDWIAAGGDAIVRAGPRGIQRTVEPGKFIVGLSAVAQGSLVAVGSDDLVLRWSGNDWVQESYSADPAKRSAALRRRLLLQGATSLAGQGLIAHGPWRVLVRHSDGSWQAPIEKERSRLATLLALGPDTPRPTDCDRVQWRWLSEGKGWLVCRDGRAFSVPPTGDYIDRGRLPVRCATTLRTVTERADTVVFATCGDGELWRARAGHWAPVPAPKLDAIAGTGRCLYGTARNTVWRNCSLP